MTSDACSPSSPSSDVIAELFWRGLINQTTDDNLPRLLMEKPRTIYIGFDPTADSLHIGHLVQLMVLRRFQRHGHRPIALVGGATGMIGDPSGKSEERKLLSPELLEANVAGMEPQLRRFLDFDPGPTAAILVNNYHWMGKFGYLEFLRDVGKHFPVNVMLTKDSVRARLDRSDAGLSYTEFSYMLLQAYDFVHLHQQYGCELQAGGSDQWGNITAGIDLARRLHGVQLYGCTCPLLTKSDGTKMGKTESGTLWLSADKTSEVSFYQYWLNTADGDVGRCLRFLTDLGKDEIDAILVEQQVDPGQRVAQRRLADDVTRLVHGEEGLRTAQTATTGFVGFRAWLKDRELRGAAPAENGPSDKGFRRWLSNRELLDAMLPIRELPRHRLSGDGLWIVDAFVESGLCKTKNEARRVITQGGAYVNECRVEGIEMKLTPTDLASESTIILRSGKKNYALLRFV